MAQRPIFLVDEAVRGLVSVRMVDFRWVFGYSRARRQACYEGLHGAARQALGLGEILEISSSNPGTLGRSLSAFNLKLEIAGLPQAEVEAIYQGSKVFQGAGPHTDLYQVSGKRAKKDDRIKKGPVIGFDLLGEAWGTSPPWAFYDWLYLNALQQNPNLADGLMDFGAFTDINFSPTKGISCQARSAALYVALRRQGRVDAALRSREDFLRIYEE